MSPSQENHVSGLYYVIPAAIMESEELSNLDKLLYGLLSGLAHASGECFPSDDYLAKRLKEPLRNAQRSVKNLEELGYISRRTMQCPKNPFRKMRIITVYHHFKKCLRNATSGGFGDACGGGLDTPPVAGIVSEVLVSEEEREGRPLEPPLSPSFFSKGVVKMPQASYEDLISKYGEERVSLTIEGLETYSKTHPHKFADYGCLAAVAKNWIERELKKGSGKACDHKTFLENFKEKFDMHPDVVICPDHIGFKFGSQKYVAVNYTDNGFKEKIEENLRRLQLY